MASIALLGVPIDLGAGRRGVDMGPSAVRYTGFQQHLTALGHTVCDLGTDRLWTSSTHSISRAHACGGT